MHLLSLTRTSLLVACALAGGCSSSGPSTTAPGDAESLAKKEEAKRDKARVDVKALADAVAAYHVNNGNPPQALQDLSQPDAGGKVIVAADALTDPWGKPYQYDPAGPKHNGEKPDVWTQAPDGTVIGNWPQKK
jgi:hypothetical protein